MAIYVNGIKIAGRGISGKSPYQVAVESGFKGTEEEFNDSLAAVGAAAEGFLELQQTVNNATTEINNAVNNARTEITILVNQANDAAENAQEIVDEAIADINRAKEDAINSIPNGDQLVFKSGSTMTGYLTLNANPTNNLHAATKAYVDSTSTEAINAVKQYTDEKTAAIVTDIWSYGSTAPSNKKLLWIDSNATTGGLKFYKNTTDGWVHVPVAWQ